MSSGPSNLYLQTEMDLNGWSGQSQSQGALFHFSAGTQIAVVVNNDFMRYDDDGTSTYLGAFLIDEDLE